MTKKKERTTKRNKMRKNRNKSRKMIRKIRKGGNCGCSSSQPVQPFYSSQAGGGYVNPATFNSIGFPATNEGGSYYPLNSYNVAGSSVVDPNAPNGGMNSRIQPNITGGRRNKKYTKKMKKQKGGSYFTDFFLGPNTGNVVTSFGNINGVSDKKNVMTETQQSDARPWAQPILKFYGSHNPPLV